MARIITALIGALFISIPLFAHAGKPDIIVITQNQYLGADLTPIISADNPADYNQAVLDALSSVANNNFPERAEALAYSIVNRKAHLVGLQEVFKFDCVESGTIPDACLLFSAAMNDHLQLTMDALEDLGADYDIAGVVNNLTIPAPDFALLGLPVFLDLDDIPDVFIQVLDRDVILARHDVTTSVVPFLCAKPSADGCNFNFVATASTLAGEINVERGFVGVDATVGSKTYRFVNTHLEVKNPSPDPISAIVQAIQASELIGTLSLTPLPASFTDLLVVGDINSSPEDPLIPLPFLPPYMQFVNGLSFEGNPISLPYTDTWDLRPGKPPGRTCCEDADLSNKKSMHYERIDIIFSLYQPVAVKANLLNNNLKDKTPSGLWPSDHASVVGRLFY